MADVNRTRHRRDDGSSGEKPGTSRPTRSGPPALSILLDEKLDLRSGWRFLLYVAVFAASLYAAGALISIFVPRAPGGELSFLALNAAGLSVPAVVALIFMLRFVDHVPLLAFGVGLHDGWGKDLGLGAALAAMMLAALVGTVALAGEIEIVPGGGMDSPAGLAALILILCISAANEEIVFRGYPLQVLMNGIGIWPAVLIMSAIFGLGHHLNPNATWLGTANTFLAGILLCSAYVRTRSLWFPYGIHIGWNLGLGPVFGFPLSGIDLRSIWNTEAAGAGWITGGAYGPEAGLLVTAIMLGAVVAVGSTGLVGVSSSVDSFLTRYSGKVHPASTSSLIGGS